MLAEVVGGFWSGSLALLADAGHMLSDSGALLVSLFALRIGSRPPSPTHTFGYQRAEILAALLNGAALLGIAGIIVYEAYERLSQPPEVKSGIMLAVAAGGLVVNLVSLKLLHSGAAHSLNVRGAFLHVLADTIGSVGAITAGVLIALFGWHWADPVASVLISVLIVVSSWSLIRETVSVLMEAVPRGIGLEAVSRSLTSVEGVTGIHDLHVWCMASGRNVVSAHLSVAPGADRQRIMSEIQHHLREDFGLSHTTIQLDCPEDCQPCAPPEAQQRRIMASEPHLSH